MAMSRRVGTRCRPDGLDLSKASPAPVNEQMAQNGFGTRSAYKLGGDVDKGSEVEESEQVEKVAGEPAITDTIEGVSTATELGAGESMSIDTTDAPNSLQDLARRTTSSTNPAQTQTRPSKTTIQPGRNLGLDPTRPDHEERLAHAFIRGLVLPRQRHQSTGQRRTHEARKRERYDEELYTPDPSTAYLPATKAEEGLLENATGTAATAAMTAAKVVTETMEGGGPVVTARPEGSALGDGVMSSRSFQSRPIYCIHGAISRLKCVIAASKAHFWSRMCLLDAQLASPTHDDSRLELLSAIVFYGNLLRG